MGGWDSGWIGTVGREYKPLGRVRTVGGSGVHSLYYSLQSLTAPVVGL